MLLFCPFINVGPHAVLRPRQLSVQPSRWSNPRGHRTAAPPRRTTRSQKVRSSGHLSVWEGRPVVLQEHLQRPKTEKCPAAEKTDFSALSSAACSHLFLLWRRSWNMKIRFLIADCLEFDSFTLPFLTGNVSWPRPSSLIRREKMACK